MLTKTKFLSELRHLTNAQPTNVLRVQQFDRLLELFRAPQPVQAAQWTSAGREGDDGSSCPGITTPARSNAATRQAKPAVIQVTSTQSASGKTSVLYLLSALAVLPREYTGNGDTVVWVDADGCFSATRMNQVLLNILSPRLPSATANDKTNISLEALRHVHVFRPQSSSQLRATLNYLPDYLLNLPSHASGSRSLDLLVLDSASVFYWQDRFEADIARYEALGTAKDPLDTSRNLATPYKTSNIISALKNLQKLFDCTILFTTSSHTNLTNTRNTNNTTITTTDGRRLPQEAPRISPWTAFATLSLTISPIKVPQFAAQMSLEECQRDQANRLVAVSNGRFVVSVDWANSETWPSGVADCVGKVGGNGSFGLRITNAGVVVEE